MKDIESLLRAQLMGQWNATHADGKSSANAVLESMLLIIKINDQQAAKIKSLQLQVDSLQELVENSKTDLALNEYEKLRALDP